MNYLLGFMFAIIGHIGVWYCHNSQFVWEWWADRPMLANVLFGLPAGIFFWYSTKYWMLATEELWSVRFLGFAASYVVFPLFTYWYMGESPFTLKTGICTGLAFLIIFVQMFVE